ncbi:MAG: hypothetical protein LUE86_14240, partial [Clostridiales bacterium]|nr:hypothetical protein [Clostridiales bacterium]
MNNNQTQNNKKKGPSYGDDPKYLTVMQKKKARWQKHPIRSFLLLPVHIFIDYIKSCSILFDH